MGAEHRILSRCSWQAFPGAAGEGHRDAVSDVRLAVGQGLCYRWSALPGRAGFGEADLRQSGPGGRCFVPASAFRDTNNWLHADTRCSRRRFGWLDGMAGMPSLVPDAGHANITTAGAWTRDGLIWIAGEAYVGLPVPCALHGGQHGRLRICVVRVRTRIPSARERGAGEGACEKAPGRIWFFSLEKIRQYGGPPPQQEFEGLQVIRL